MKTIQPIHYPEIGVMVTLYDQTAIEADENSHAFAPQIEPDFLVSETGTYYLDLLDQLLLSKKLGDLEKLGQIIFILEQWKNKVLSDQLMCSITD